MAMEFELDAKAFIEALKKSPEAAGKGAAQAMDDIKDDWVRHARDIAPISPKNGGNLRRQIEGDTGGRGVDQYVEVQSNASQDTGGKRFNYAWYIHEENAGGRNLRTPGTVKQYLYESGDKRSDKWQKWLEEEIEDALEREGW